MVPFRPVGFRERLMSTCSTCSAPLPTMAADIRRPHLCGSCLGTPPGPVVNSSVAPLEMAPPIAPPPGAAPPPPMWQPTAGASAGWGVGPNAAAGPGGQVAYGAMVTKTRPLDAVLVGIAAAALAGLAWWASVAFTENLFVYAAIIVGIVVGQGVLIGARRGGVVPALLAGVFTLAALVVAQYFIERSLAISKFGAQDLPLWLGFSAAKDVVRSSVDGDPKIGLFWALSVGAALISAGSSSRRPAL